MSEPTKPIPEAMIKKATTALEDITERLEFNEEMFAKAALEAAHYGELADRLEQVTILARIKYGNLDKDVDRYLTETEALLVKIKGTE